MRLETISLLLCLFVDVQDSFMIGHAMRFRLKKTIKIFIVFVVLVIYYNFSDVIRISLSKTSDDKKHHENEQPHPKLVIYPSEIHYGNDRIREQVKFIPASIKAKQGDESKIPLKTILLASGLGGWAVKRGQATFKEQRCAVQHCLISDNSAKMKEADLLLFEDFQFEHELAKPKHQIWVLNFLESPYHTPPILPAYRNKFNWTATYRHDSTIVTPYEKFVPFKDNVLRMPQSKNYATGKKKMAAWFVSNCDAINNRMEYATALSKYIQVDIYGMCGTLSCPRHQIGDCFDMLNKDYRFYLAFENSNCRDYITEKFFDNGLKHDVVPIVMGASPEDYERVAPPHSFIHVDSFASPKELADYLHLLASDDNLYNEYFQWKGTGRLVNTYFWCRVCALAHDVERRGSSWYPDVDTWWKGGDTCIGQKSWRDVRNRTRIIGQLAVVEEQLGS